MLAHAMNYGNMLENYWYETGLLAGLPTGMKLD